MHFLRCECPLFDFFLSANRYRLFWGEADKKFGVQTLSDMQFDERNGPHMLMMCAGIQDATGGGCSTRGCAHTLVRLMPLSNTFIEPSPSKCRPHSEVALEIET
jgi:hypothetical protein